MKNAKISATQTIEEKLIEIFFGEKCPTDICRADTGEIIIPANTKITKFQLKEIAAHRENIACEYPPIRNKIKEIIKSVE